MPGSEGPASLYLLPALASGRFNVLTVRRMGMELIDTVERYLVSHGFNAERECDMEQLLLHIAQELRALRTNAICLDESEAGTQPFLVRAITIEPERGFADVFVEWQEGWSRGSHPTPTQEPR